MTKSIEQARRDVHDAFDSLVVYADSDEARTLHELEHSLWPMLLQLGKTMVILWLIRQVARPRPMSYKYHSKRFEIRPEEERNCEIGTIFGKVTFPSPVARRVGYHAKLQCDLPVNREVGLCSGFSLTVVMGMSRLCSQMPFKAAREMWRDFFLWSPSSKAVLRMVDATGKESRPFLEQAELPTNDGEILVCQVDGGAAPMISPAELALRKGHRKKHAGGETQRQRRRQRRQDRPHPRRTKGKKSKNGKEAFVGVIYTLRQTENGLEGPINKRVIGTFESHRALFVWLRAEAERRGYGRKRTLFLADGSRHIWKLQQQYFPEAESCLDWYHLVEYLWKAGSCIYKEGSDAIRQWVSEQKERLRQGDIEAVLDELDRRLKAVPKTGPGTKGRRKRLGEVIGYMTKNKVRMPYAKFLEEGLDIGSGAVEGAIRHVVRLRLDSSGMRWGRGRSELVLHLRCIFLNGQWSEFIAYIAGLEEFGLAPQPAPALPHAAKAKV